MSSLHPVTGSAGEVTDLLRVWRYAATPKPLEIATSGSTGEPKRVLLSRAAMMASANATAAALGGPGQWVLNLPPTYVAGVQVLFRSLLAEIEPVVMTPGETWAQAAQRRDPAARTYASLVPTQLVRLLGEDEEVDALTRLDAILVGGGPLDPVVRSEAEAAGIHIVQTYGMSETCGGCVYDGVPVPGVDIRIEDGQVLVRGPMLFDGYADQPERTAAALRDGWLLTNDTGEIGADGRLRITGRCDDVIISGGVKVPALAVAAQLAAHLHVREVAVVGVDDPEWGQRVVAAIVGDEAVTLASVRDGVQPREWAPRQLMRLNELPYLSNGKIDRVRIRELAEDG